MKKFYLFFLAVMLLSTLSATQMTVVGEVFGYDG